MDERKYDVFFSLKNIYAVFRQANSRNMLSNKSNDYEVLSVQEHYGLSVEDTIKDIMLLMRSGAINIVYNDVLVIKTNGLVACFRFRGIRNNNSCYWKRNFVVIDDFIAEERKQIIQVLHQGNEVIDVIERKPLYIRELDLQKNMYFGISCEPFQYESKSHEMIQSEYFLYCLNEYNQIIRIDAGAGKPFYSLKNIFNYFNLIQKGKKKKHVLLLNRTELEMVKDYYELKMQIVS